MTAIFVIVAVYIVINTILPKELEITKDGIKLKR